MKMRNLGDLNTLCNFEDIIILLKFLTLIFWYLIKMKNVKGKI